MRLRPMLFFLASLLAISCADTSFLGGDAGAPCEATERSTCESNVFRSCVDGRWQSLDCGKEKTCIKGLGCRTCAPKTQYCKGQDTYTCDADGKVETKTGTCPAQQQCVLGDCMDLCDLQRKDRSNVGCTFWAVDLPNEYSCISIDGGKTCVFGYNCAACQQFAVAIANTSTYTVGVTVEINEAAPGQPRALKKVTQRQVRASSIEVINLPMREVDCTTWYKDTTGKLRRKNDSQSCLSSRAYRITSTYPVVAYQFNPIINDFSNGASLLIPENGLDKSYYVLGWSTTNPFTIPIPGQTMEGIPDYMNMTIVGVQEGTEVQITPAHQIQGSKDGKIPAAQAGQPFTVKLGPFDVLNLNSRQDLQHITGDFTGSKIVSNKNVVVFSGGQRASVPINLDMYNPKPPPPANGTCCTEHFEQQMFPISSLGKNFALSRTPVRSTGPVIEPDFYRLLATEDATVIKTNLSDFPRFSLKTGEQANFWSNKSFVLESTKPIMIAQYAVAQGYLDSYKTGGDPEFVVFPPVEQYRKEYIFLTPPTFDADYVVISAPTSAKVDLDGKRVSGEFNTVCHRQKAGTIGSVRYVALTCSVQDGVHRLKASVPVGIMVYGYYSVGSYGYPGGADVKRINID